MRNVQAKVIMVRNYHAEIDQGEASSLPICVEFKHLRRSRRLPAEKRKYKKMQGAGRLAKRPKLPNDKCPTDTLPTDGSLDVPVADRSTSGTSTETHSEHLSEMSEIPTNTSATCTLGTSEPTVECPNTAEVLHPSGTYDLPTSATQVHMEGDETVDNLSSATHQAGYETVDNMSPATHRAGYDIINDFFGRPTIGPETVSGIEGTGKLPASTAESAPQDEDLECIVPPNTLKSLDASQRSSSPGINTGPSKDSGIPEPNLSIASVVTSGSSSPESSERGSSSTGSTSCTSPETHIHGGFPSGVHTAHVKRLILDDPTPWFEDVLTALELESNDTSRRQNPVPGVLDDILTKGNFILYVSIMTSIAENQVKCNRYIAKPAFDAAQERSQEAKGNKIGLYSPRLTSEYVPRQRHEKASLEDIARLDIRELAEVEMQKLLSEPEELTGEFRKESDYETAIKNIEKENADGERTQLRRL